MELKLEPRSEIGEDLKNRINDWTKREAKRRAYIRELPFFNIQISFLKALKCKHASHKEVTFHIRAVEGILGASLIKNYEHYLDMKRKRDFYGKENEFQYHVFDHYIKMYEATIKYQNEKARHEEMEEFKKTHNEEFINNIKLD